MRRGSGTLSGASRRSWMKWRAADRADSGPPDDATRADGGRRIPLSLGGTTGALVRKAQGGPSGGRPIVRGPRRFGEDARRLGEVANGFRPCACRYRLGEDRAERRYSRGGRLGPAGRLRHRWHERRQRRAGRGPGGDRRRSRPQPRAMPREAAAFKQLARIFANMKTTDAAKVLAYMSDDEVQGVLQQLGVRPAAGLLAALPKERAAAAEPPAAQGRAAEGGHAMKPIQSSDARNAGDLLPAFAQG